MLRSSVTKFAAVPLTMAGMATLKADLTAQRTSAQGELSTLAAVRKDISAASHKSADKAAVGGFVLLATQAAVLFNWTFINFDWNLVEPITYLLGYSVVWLAILPHFFWGKDLSYDTIRSAIVDRKKNALIKEKKFDAAYCSTLESRVVDLDNAIEELSAVKTNETSK